MRRKAELTAMWVEANPDKPIPKNSYPRLSNSKKYVTWLLKKTPKTEVDDNDPVLKGLVEKYNRGQEALEKIWEKYPTYAAEKNLPKA